LHLGNTTPTFDLAMKNLQRFGMKQPLLAFALSTCLTSPAFAGPVLKGNVTEQNKLNNTQTAPGLSRNDINNTDEFSGPAQSQGQDQGLAPPNFAVESMLPPGPPPKKSFPLNAESEGNDEFNPQMMQGVPDQMRQQAPPQQMGTTTPNNFAQDPDATPDMQLLWDIWHKRVAAAVYQRYAALSNAAFSMSRRPLMAVAGYTVTRDGRIVGARLLQPSWNPIYNTLILGVINSINGDMSVLAFPPGSRRMMVEKSATFSQNYGHEGFRYTTGDTEKIRQQRLQQGFQGR
jgi:hypothetical protein